MSTDLTPKRWRKKPVVIDAHQFKGAEPVENVPEWYALAVLNRELEIRKDGRLRVATLEDGLLVANVAELGDWIIRGVNGDLYPCKPDIFAATYEPADAPPPSAAAPVVPEGYVLVPLEPSPLEIQSVQKWLDWCGENDEEPDARSGCMTVRQACLAADRAEKGGV